MNLEESRDGWLQWSITEEKRAEKGRATHQSAKTGFLVVKALDKEIEFGERHCVNCQQRISVCKCGKPY